MIVWLLGSARTGAASRGVTRPEVERCRSRRRGLELPLSRAVRCKGGRDLLEAADLELLAAVDGSSGLLLRGLLGRHGVAAALGNLAVVLPRERRFSCRWRGSHRGRISPEVLAAKGAA